MGNRGQSRSGWDRFSKGLRKTGRAVKRPEPFSRELWAAVGNAGELVCLAKAPRAFPTAVHSPRQPRQIHSPLLRPAYEDVCFHHYAARPAACRSFSNRARCEAISFSLLYRSFVVISL